MGKSNSYLLIYMSNFFLASLPMTSIGGLIPFLAAELNIQETEYSVIFLMLSLSNIIAASVYKFLQGRALLLSHHNTLFLCAVGMAFFSFMSGCMASKFLQCLAISAFNFFWYIQQIVVNICLILAPPKADIAQWLSFAHGSYGLGGLVGPIMVGLFRQNYFFIVCVTCSALALGYRSLPTPQASLGETSTQEEHQNFQTSENRLRPASKRLEILFSLGFFTISGIEIAIQSWTPTYAIMNGISTKTQAVRFPSLFWATSTLFRFIFGSLRISGAFKVPMLVTSQLASGVVSTLLSMGSMPLAAAYFCSIFYGFSMSQLFPLLLAVSREFNISFSDSQIANMVISTTVSPLLSSLTGGLMSYGANFFFFSVLCYGVGLFAIGKMIMAGLRAESRKGQESMEMLLKKSFQER